MPRKIIKLNSEARKSLKKGIDAVADAVKVTLGPSGRNAILGHMYQSPEVTNDGVSIAMEIYLDDEIEQLGADKMKEICKGTDDKAGDGTTTATVLAQAIMNTGFERLDVKGMFTKEQINPISIKKEIDVTCETVCKELDKLAKPISSIEDIYKVAFVSVESVSIAKTISEMFHKIGKDGVITVEDGYMELESEVVEGLELEAGLTSDVLAGEDNKLTIDKPLFLVTNEKIEFAEQIIGLTNPLNNDGIKNLVIIADDFSKEILHAFVVAKLQGQFNIIAVKPPYVGKKEKMQDVAIALGATFFDKDADRRVKEANITDLGSAKKIVMDKDKTIILGGKGDTKARLSSLKEELKGVKNKFDQEQLKKRIAKLGGGIGVIKVGAESDTERGYLKKKIEDAVNATKYALQEGVVKGGGITLKQIADKLPVNILTEALNAPYNQIQENAGGNLEISDDIIDPVRTTKTALRSACSVAGLILTTDVAIADKYENPKDFTEE